MWLEAIATRDDVAALLVGLMPVTIALGDKGELTVGAPTEIELVEGLGLRLVCEVRLRWDLLGIPVPVSASAVGVLLKPEISDVEGRSALVFKLALEHAEIAGVPAFLEQSVTERVNRALEEKHVQLAWAYGGTLSHVFALPALLQPPRQIALTAVGGRIKATAHALGFAVEMRAGVSPGGGAPQGTRVEPPPARPPGRGASTRGAITLGVSLAALAFAGTYALGRASSRRRRR